MTRALLFLALTLPTQAFAGRGASATLGPLPASYSVETATNSASTAPWWHAFNDPAFTELMENGLAANFDLQAASDRIRLADAQAQSSLSPLLPQINFGYNISGAPDEVLAGRTGFLTTDILPDFTYSASGSLAANLGLDITGRHVLGYQAARGDKLASSDDRAELAMGIASRIANLWFDLSLQQQQLVLLEQQVTSNELVLELTELAYARGEGSSVQVLQQRRQLDATKAQLPLVHAGVAVTKSQLAILLGKAPGTLTFAVPEVLPALPPSPSLGTPTELMDNRPDLRAADARLTSAWQRRMASERAFLPSLSIGASLDGSYSNTQNINIGLNTTVEFGSFYGWGINAAISMPIFDGGRNIATLRSSRASEAAASHSVSSTALLALAEVEGAVAQETGQVQRAELVRTQAVAAKAAFDAAVLSYRSGAGNYLEVLSTLVGSQNADLSLLQAQRDVLTARLSLYDALGGSWTSTLARTVFPGGSR